MPRRSICGTPLALVLMTAVAGAQQPSAPASATARPAGRAYKVAAWYDAARPTTSIEFQVYDVAKGEYDAVAVDHWLDQILTKYPDNGAYVRDIRTDGLPGATEAERLAKAIEDEKHRWAAIQRQSFSSSTRSAITFRTSSTQPENAGRSTSGGRPPGLPGRLIGPPTSPFPYPHRSGPASSRPGQNGPTQVEISLEIRAGSCYPLRIASRRRGATAPALRSKQAGAVRLRPFPLNYRCRAMIRLIDAKKSYGRQTFMTGSRRRSSAASGSGCSARTGRGSRPSSRSCMGVEHLDSGEVLRDRKCSIGYLPQEIHPLKEGTVFENMLAHLGPWTEADRRLKAVMAGWSRATRKALDDYDDAMEAFVSAGGYEMESRAKAILLGLGFSVSQLDAPVASLSGGWAMRLALGGLLAFEHDLLLLDEPTNHLDLLSVKWFEDFLQSYPGAILITCHDRDFLDRVITKTFELELGNLFTLSRQLLRVPPPEGPPAGRASGLVRRPAEEAQADAGLRRPQPRQCRDGRPAQSRIKAIEKMERIDAPQTDNSSMRIKMPEPPRSGQVVAKLRDVGFAYGPKVVYSGLDLDLERGDHVVLVGPNGAGKTTLMKLLTGILKPQKGEVALGANVFANVLRAAPRRGARRASPRDR